MLEFTGVLIFLKHYTGMFFGVIEFYFHLLIKVSKFIRAFLLGLTLQVGVIDIEIAKVGPGFDSPEAMN